MKYIHSLLLIITFSTNSFGQDLIDFLDIIREHDKNDKLVSKFILGTTTKVVPKNHYYHIEYIINSNGIQDNDAVLAMGEKDAVINYKNFYFSNMPVMFYIGTMFDFSNQSQMSSIKSGDFPLSPLPLYFPESYSIAAVNSKIKIHIAEYAFSQKNIQRIDTLKIQLNNKEIEEQKAKEGRIKKHKEKEEEEILEKEANEARKIEVQVYIENSQSINELEKQLNAKYIKESKVPYTPIISLPGAGSIKQKIKKKSIYNKGYEILYLNHLKPEIAKTRYTKEKIEYQDKAINLINKMIRVFDSDTKELEKRLNKETDISKIQAIFDELP